MKMFLQKILFVTVTLITKVFRLESSWSVYTNDKGQRVYDGSMMYGFGPRIAVMRANGDFQLTGIFAIKTVKTKDEECISCKPFVFIIAKDDKVYFGEAAQKMCREVHPPLPKDHVPMFRDGDGCSWG